MATFATLRQAIYSKLQGITALNQVVNHHTENFTGWPVATFEPSNNTNAFMTNADNIRAYAFDIYVFQEVEKGGRANAVTVLINAVDAIIDAFDRDFDLGGACNYCQPTPSDWGDAVIGNASVLYAKIQIVGNAEVQVIT